MLDFSCFFFFFFSFALFLDVPYAWKLLNWIELNFVKLV